MPQRIFWGRLVTAVVIAAIALVIAVLPWTPTMEAQAPATATRLDLPGFDGNKPVQSWIIEQEALGTCLVTVVRPANDLRVAQSCTNAR